MNTNKNCIVFCDRSFWNDNIYIRLPREHSIIRLQFDKYLSETLTNSTDYDARRCNIEIYDENYNLMDWNLDIREKDKLELDWELNEYEARYFSLLLTEDMENALIGTFSVRDLTNEHPYIIDHFELKR